MQIVIDIPEEEYKRWKEDGEIDALIVRDALQNGTPLPKGHGRLIDADSMIADILTVNPQFESMIEWCAQVTNAQPTIIEAEVAE